MAHRISCWHWTNYILNENKQTMCRHQTHEDNKKIAGKKNVQNIFGRLASGMGRVICHFSGFRHSSIGRKSLRCTQFCFPHSLNEHFGLFCSEYIVCCRVSGRLILCCSAKTSSICIATSPMMALTSTATRRCKRFPKKVKINVN